VFADPPYNMSKKKGLGWKYSNHITMQEEWDMFSKDEFFQFNKEWLKECFRVLKHGGSLWISGSFHNIYEGVRTREHLMTFGRNFEVSKGFAIDGLETYRSPKWSKELVDSRDQSYREEYMGYFVTIAASMIRTGLLSKNMKELEMRGQNETLSEEDKMYAGANASYWNPVMNPNMHGGISSYLSIARDLNDVGIEREVNETEIQRSIEEIAMYREREDIPSAIKMASICNSLYHLGIADIVIE